MKKLSLILLTIMLTMLIPIHLVKANHWVEVVRFTGGSTITTTEDFTCDYVDWRIRWEIEPRNDSIRTVFRVYIFPYSDAFPREPWFESIQKYGTEETSGILYIHDHNGSLDMDVLASLESYTLIIEQDLDSIPEFPSWFILPILIASTLVVMFVRNKLSRKGLE